jgi:hypothetical protein
MIVVSCCAVGRGTELIGEGVRVSRVGAAAMPLDEATVEYDASSPSVPVLLASRTYHDGVTVEVRTVQVDNGWQPTHENDGGYLLNVTVRNARSASTTVELAAAVDWLAGLVSAKSPPTALSTAGHKPVVCGSAGGWTAAPASAAGRVSAGGFRPGRNTETTHQRTVSAAPPSPSWAETWALSGNYPGQTGHVGRVVGGGILKYSLTGLPKSAEVYLAIAPAAIISSGVGLPVEAGDNHSLIPGGKVSSGAVFFLATKTDADGSLEVAMGAVKSAPKGWSSHGNAAVSALWYAYRTRDLLRL